MGAVRALVCDDDPVARRLVARMLEEHGCQLVAEVDLAVDALRVTEMSRPDLVVLDVALMGMTGIEVIPAIKRVAPGCHVVVFSAFDAASDDALAAGADAVVDKAEPDRLDEAIAAAVSR